LGFECEEMIEEKTGLRNIKEEISTYSFQ